MNIVILTHNGQIGSLQANTIRTQQRGGRGTQSFPLEQGDRVVGVLAANDADKVLIFTTHGRAFCLDNATIPALSHEQKPVALADMVSIKEAEHPAALMVLPTQEDLHIFFATRGGMVKKTSAGEYHGISDRGLIAISLDDHDALVGTSVTEAERDIFLATAGGLAIRFAQSEVKATGRDTRGVRGIRLREGDTVTSLLIATPDDAIATVAAHGFGKRSPADEYRCTSRGGTGITSIKSSERNGDLVALAIANDGSDLLLATQTGRVLRTDADSIRMQSRNTAGVRLFELDSEETVVSAIPLNNA